MESLLFTLKEALNSWSGATHTWESSGRDAEKSARL